MIPRYKFVNYDRAHASAEIIFNMLIVRIKIQIRIDERKKANVPRT